MIILKALADYLLFLVIRLWSSLPKRDGPRKLSNVADKPKTKVRIAVYSAASVTHAHKQKLGKSRANAVAEYLISEDLITRDRLYTIGYGETNPTMYEAAPKEICSKSAKANTWVLFEIIVQ